MAIFDSTNYKKKTHKLNYFAPSTWRKLFLIKNNVLYQAQDKYIHDRASTIPLLFKGQKVHIYMGKKYHRRFISRWSVGFKFGELTWNRRLALYKAKQLRKKKKK